MKKNYTISLDVEVQQAFKGVCANDGVSVSEKINLLMKEFIENQNSRMKSVEEALKSVINRLDTAGIAEEKNPYDMGTDDNDKF